MKKQYTCLFMSLLILFIDACTPKFKDPTPIPDGQGSGNTKMDKLMIPANFNFNTSTEVRFEISTLNNADKPIKGVVIAVYSYPDNKLLFKAASPANGVLSISQKIPTYVTKVAVRPSLVGLPAELIVEIVNNKVLLKLGGKDAETSAFIFDSLLNNASARAAARINTQDYPPYTYLGDWNGTGVPKYLERGRDEISPKFLESINASLPEGDPIPKTHPSYLNANNRNNIYIKEASDVWVTFVHEGTDWQNTLGYYTFNPKAPPAKPSDISKISIIFPNVSYKGSGGGLVSGDRVKLGKFQSGTAIGFVLIADAYKDKTVGKGNYAHYSNDALNIETSKEIKRHLIVLNDLETKRMVLAFEDVSRQNEPIKCDNDFNDAIFYITTNPSGGVDADYIPLAGSKTDTDKDGIEDSEDEYMKDAAKALSNYTPDKDAYNSLAFEDLWPFKGDYDMNDLVINYQFQEIMNAKNQVVEIKVKAYVKAIGASFQSGWGFELPVETSLVKSVSGTSTTEGIIKTLPSGVEADQKFATIIAFDNAFKQVKSVKGFVNTEPGSEMVAPADTLNIHIVFTAPIDKTELGNAPFNPFIFKTAERDKEIHLPNNKPTSRADLSQLGKGNDRSVSSKGVYYKTANGLPWAIDFSSDFNYPAERNAVVDAYLKFGEWAESGGKEFTDWYLLSKKYIDDSKIYKGKK